MTCRICHFEYVLDDEAAPRICVRCFAREIGNEYVMPPKLRRQLIEFLNTLPV